MTSGTIRPSSGQTDSGTTDDVIDAPSDSGKLFAAPRIFNDLLSSQPLCFNLFGELKHDLRLASAVFATLTAGRFANVTRIDFNAARLAFGSVARRFTASARALRERSSVCEFEHSPGRGDPRVIPATARRSMSTSSSPTPTAPPGSSASRSSITRT